MHNFPADIILLTVLPCLHLVYVGFVDDLWADAPSAKMQELWKRQLMIIRCINISICYFHLETFHCLENCWFKSLAGIVLVLIATIRLARRSFSEDPHRVNLLAT